MIHEPHRLRELVEELAELPLETRRAFITQIGESYGKAAAEQIKQALLALWDKR